MDPDAAWTDLLKAIENGDPESALEFASALLGWLAGGGFPPKVCLAAKDGNPLIELDAELARSVCTTACQVTLKKCLSDTSWRN